MNWGARLSSAGGGFYAVEVWEEADVVLLLLHRGAGLQGERFEARRNTDNVV